MSRTRLDAHGFWQQSPAAKEVFEYVDALAAELGSGWGFDHGWVLDDPQVSTAVFSCTALTGWGKDTLRVTASLKDSTWQISHEIERAK